MPAVLRPSVRCPLRKYRTPQRPTHNTHQFISTRARARFFARLIRRVIARPTRAIESPTHTHTHASLALRCCIRLPTGAANRKKINKPVRILYTLHTHTPSTRGTSSFISCRTCGCRCVLCVCVGGVRAPRTAHKPRHTCAAHASHEAIHEHIHTLYYTLGISLPTIGRYFLSIRSA